MPDPLEPASLSAKQPLPRPAQDSSGGTHEGYRRRRARLAAGLQHPTYTRSVRQSDPGGRS